MGLHLSTSDWLAGSWAVTALAVVDMLQAGSGSAYFDTLDCFASFGVGIVPAGAEDRLG